MKIDAIRFRHVGPFGADGIRVEGIQPGLNVIAEHNERGKSSLLAGLNLIFFTKYSSAAQDVKRLRRVGESPFGQVDFTHHGTPYRLEKQFLAGKKAVITDLSQGSVIARQGEAEERLAKLLGRHPDTNGPSGLLWVRQGDSMNPVQDDGQVASRLESELSTLVGGDRARAYLDRAETDLSSLLTTTGRVKAGGPLGLAEDALARVQSELDTALTAQKTTRQLGHDLVRVQTKIASLEADYNPAKDLQDLEEARAALDQARIAKSELDRQRAHLGRLRAEREQAQQRLATHETEVAALDHALSEAQRLSQEIETLSQQKADAQDQLNTATQTLAALDEASESLRQLDTLKDVQDQLSRQNGALQSLTENLEQLDADIAQRNALMADRAALPLISRQQLDRLDQLDREREQIEAQYRGISAHLRLTLEPGVKASLGDTPVGSGPIRIDATQALQIEGAGTLTLDPTELGDLEARKASIQEEHSALLTEMEIEDYAAALEAFRQRDELSNEIALTDQKIAIVAPHGQAALIDKKDTLTQDVSRLRTRFEQLSEMDLETLDSETLSRDLAQARGTYQAAQETMRQIDRDLAICQEKLAEQNRVIERADDRRKAGQREALSGQLAAAAATLSEQVRQAEEDLRSAEAQTQDDPDRLQARIQRLTDAARNQSQKLADLRQEEAALIATRKASFEQRDPDAEVDRLEAQRLTLEEEIRQHRRRAQALHLLRDTLREAQSSLQTQYTDPVKQELLPLLRMVIENVDVDLNENLGAKGLVRDGDIEKINRLSGGTREQIAILTRLAFARMLSRQGHPSPVILDDALVYADDQRRQRMFEVMNYVTSGSDPLQLLYLSCHERSTRELGGHILSLQPWPE